MLLFFCELRELFNGYMQELNYSSKGGQIIKKFANQMNNAQKNYLDLQDLFEH